MACPLFSALPSAIVLHMASVHIPERDYNNFNPGIAAQFTCSETISFQAGTYANSSQRQTFYAGIVYEPKRFPIFLSVSAATGYQSYPIPVPMFGFKLGPYIRIGFIPYAGRFNDSGVAHLMFQIPLR
jgi:hypothetical protein